MEYKEIDRMKICSSCGASNADNSKFCETCGTPLAEAAAPEAAASEEPAAAPEPAPAAVPAAAPAASDYQQESQASKSAYYEEPKAAHAGNAVGIEERNIGLAILFSFLTCGIYMLYWHYKKSEEFRQLTGDQSLPEGGMTILLSIVTCNIYLIYWHYKMGQASDQLKGDPNGNSGVINLLLYLFGLGLVSLILEQSAINQAVRAA